MVGLDISPPPEDFCAGEWVQGDILDAGSYAGKLRGIDVVIHLAAMAHSVPGTKEEADRFWTVNLEGTKTLIAAAVEQGVRRFVHVSTVAVLSPSDGGIASAYADSKRAAEREVFDFGDRIEVVVVRPTTVYGPNDRGNIYKLIRWVDRGLPAIIGSGENRKSLVYSRNLADALLFLSEHGKSGESYVVTDGHDMSMKEIVQGISRSLGRGEPVAVDTFGSGECGHRRQRMDRGAFRCSEVFRAGYGCETHRGDGVRSIAPVFPRIQASVRF